MRASDIRHQTSGYTLLEVLIASAIFVGVLMIGTSSFTTASRLRERTLDQQQTTETARFIAETLARDIRSATGQRTTDGSTSLLACPAPGYLTTPYDFYKSGQITCALKNGLVEATGIETHEFDPALNAVTKHLYEYSDTNKILTVRKNGGAPESLLPTGFTIKDVTFQGLSHGVSGLRSQPFVRFTLTVVSTATGNSQTIQTSVESRELR